MRPNYSSDAWTVEPFDSKLDLWSLGKGSDFIWVLLAADPEGERYRTLPRAEGLSEIQARRGRQVLGGAVQSSMVKPGKRRSQGGLHKQSASLLLG